MEGLASESLMPEHETQPLLAAAIFETAAAAIPPPPLAEAQALPGDQGSGEHAADAAVTEEAKPELTEEELKERLLDAHAKLRKALVRNRDFVHFGRLPHFVNALNGDSKPFVRVKVADGADGPVYRLGRAIGCLQCDAYVVVPTTGARLDFEVSIDTVDKPVRITSISNRSASLEDITEYMRHHSHTIDNFAGEVSRALASRATLCAERVKDLEEARKVASRNSTLAPQPHLAMQISALQRETTTRMSQADAGETQLSAPTQLANSTPAVPSPSDHQVATMLDLERQFTSYVEETLDTPSTALMRDLTLRNRSKNNVSTVQAVENFKKYPRQATFSDEGLLWEVDAAKRNLLCEQYDEIKEGNLNADELMPESLRIKPPAPDPREGMSFVERCVADAFEASQRNQTDLSQLDASGAAEELAEPVSLARLASRSSKKHRPESQL